MWNAKLGIIQQEHFNIQSTMQKVGYKQTTDGQVLCGVHKDLNNMCTIKRKEEKETVKTGGSPFKKNLYFQHLLNKHSRRSGHTGSHAQPPTKGSVAQLLGFDKVQCDPVVQNLCALEE